MSYSSTPAASGVSDLFMTPDGASLRIFFQAQSIPRRAQLAKILLKGSAQMCTDPKDADILLVNTETVDGRIHIRTWVAEGGKLGLHYGWIDACVKAGRMLGEADGWGGFIAVDDGAPLDDEDDGLLDPAQNPLPTPRQTQSPDNPPRSVSHATVASSSTAISDELLNDPDKKLRKNGMRLQAVIPTLFGESTDEFEVAPPSISERARGKQKDTSYSVSTASRMTSVSVPPVSPTKSAASPAPPEGLFMKHGKPIEFYVQADYFQRKDLVKKIKRHGGLIVGHVKEADYAILYAKAVNRKEYQSSLTSAMADGIPAIEGRFVEDCIARNNVLDYKAYVFVPIEKRKRTTSANYPTSSEDDEPLSQRAKKLKLEDSFSKPAKLSKGSPSKTSVSISRGKPTSASKRPVSSSSSKPSSSSKTVLAKPPPTKERLVFKYTEEELKLAYEMAFEYWEEDYRRSDSQLAVLLHAKMPDHTLRSWKTCLNQGRKKEFGDVWKRAGIQCRKREAQEKVEQQDRFSRASSFAEESQGAASRRSSVPSIQQISPPAPPSVPLPSLAPRTIEQDAERFANFLAFEGGDLFDPNDPMSAYRALSDKSPWRSAEEWGAFWTAEWGRINPLYAKKLEQVEAMQQQSREDTFKEGEVSLGDRPRNY